MLASSKHRQEILEEVMGKDRFLEFKKQSIFLDFMGKFKEVENEIRAAASTLQSSPHLKAPQTAASKDLASWKVAPSVTKTLLDADFTQKPEAVVLKTSPLKSVNMQVKIFLVDANTTNTCSNDNLQQLTETKQDLQDKFSALIDIATTARP
jgi:hypothetical protein